MGVISAAWGRCRGSGSGMRVALAPAGWGWFLGWGVGGGTMYRPYMAVYSGLIIHADI